MKSKINFKMEGLVCAVIDDGNRLIGCSAHPEAVPPWPEGIVVLYGLKLYLRGKKGQLKREILENKFDELN